jgi:adenine-specific DNA-methyltransferase
MAKQLQKLELTWIGKDKEPRLEPRILIEDTSKSYGDITSENMLINGDNLLALKALEQYYTGKIKCICIDPPYNTGSAFEHYDDGIEHSLWLSLMRDRLKLFNKLLSKDGSIWIAIDDNEAHYLKVLCDEVFGRKSFVATVVWENFYGRSNAAAISPSHNYIFIYSPMGLDWKKVRNLLERDEKSSAKYTNPDNDIRGMWRAGPIFAAEERHEGLMYEITTPSGRKVKPPKGSHWRMVESEFWEMVKEGRIIFGAKGDNNPAVKLFLNEVQSGLVPRSWWPHTEVGHSQEAKREIQALFKDEIPFATPKPERLIQRIIQVASDPNDIVLDSFLGSGTTAAVAQKMNRKWIGIELGEHATTHCLPRLKQVISGQDKGGITESVNWKGGGGFKFYTLAPSLIQKDKYGSEIINPSYNPNMLAAAMAKQEGFRYSPDESNYWRQGFSSEKDFIFTTTQFITVQMLDRLAEELQPTESLLVCCKSFAKGCVNRHSNITIKKIPQMLLGRCEFGKDDYSLNIVNLPHDDDDNIIEDNAEVAIELKISKSKKKKADDDSQPSLF